MNNRESPIPQSICEFLKQDFGPNIVPEYRQLDEIHLLDGTIIKAKDFRHAFDQMFLYIENGARKTLYSPYTAISKIVISDKT